MHQLDLGKNSMDGKRVYIFHEDKQDEPIAVVESKKSRKYPSTRTAIDLAMMEFDPIQFIIAGLLPIGLSIIVGLSKIGKSLLTVMMTLAVGNGQRLFETLDTIKSQVLLLSMEDKERTLHNRVIKMLPKYPASDEVKVATEWGHDFEENLQFLKAYLEDHSMVRLVVIDTLSLFCGESNKGTYTSDYKNLSKLRDISIDYDISILAVHHIVKNPPKDWLSAPYGSHGISGAADSIMFLERNRELKSAKLRYAVRDGESGSHSLRLNSKNLTWEEAGSPHPLQNKPEQRQLFDILHSAKRPMTLAEITNQSGKKKTNVHKMLRSMVGKGILLQSKHGVYAIARFLEDNPNSMVDQVDFPSPEKANAANTSEFRYLWS
ncbi:AAA family ATPase [bacterium]|nr:AAA family ATPase [bacterium]